MRELRKPTRNGTGRTRGPTLAHPIGMVVAERDWLLLRGRLRRFVSLAALPVMTAVTR